MDTQHWEAYRAFDVQVELVEMERACFNGNERRYKVRWSVARSHNHKGFKEILGVFTEPLAFVSMREATQYGKARAHLWVDCIVKFQDGNAAAPTTARAQMERTA
jgi:hypothetical protein